MTQFERIAGMSLKYGVILLAVLFAGFRLTEAVHANTQQARENITALQHLSDRVDSLEHWRVDTEAFDKGYRAGIKEVEGR